MIDVFISRHIVTNSLHLGLSTEVVALSLESFLLHSQGGGGRNTVCTLNVPALGSGQTIDFAVRNSCLGC
jgi:hypothetical protein